MGETTNEHRIGAQGARIQRLEDDHDDLKAELRAIREELGKINQNIASAGGGWKVLVVMGSMIAAVSAMLASWFHR